MKMTVGYARIDITPDESVPLGGYGNTSGRMSKNILDPLYATCIAFVNEAGEKALVYTVDLINAGITASTEIRPEISRVTGIPVECIQISGTHTHSGPDTVNLQEPSIVRFNEQYKQKMVRAAVEALEDAKPAQLQLARVITKNMNFVRIYLMADGTYAGPNFGNQNQPYVGHESEADPELQLARIAREGGKDIVLCNFGIHQTNSGGAQKFDISADIAGAMRAEYEANDDCWFAYFTGACGNLTPNSRIAEENPVTPKDFVAHGKMMAGYALGARGSYEPACFGPIRGKSYNSIHPINHEYDHMLPQAQEINDLYASTNDRKLANKVAREKYGFSSVHHASSIVRRCQMGAEEVITIDVLTVGDLAFAMAPYEMYDTNGVEIKQGSPFKMTFVLTLANQNSIGYLPTKLNFEHGGYAVDICRFVPGVGEVLSEAYVKMLNELK